MRIHVLAIGGRPSAIGLRVTIDDGSFGSRDSCSGASVDDHRGGLIELRFGVLDDTDARYDPSPLNDGAAHLQPGFGLRMEWS